MRAADASADALPLTSTATNRHNGRWTLQQQVIVLTPDRALGDDPSELAVGSGVLNTPRARAGC